MPIGFRLDMSGEGYEAGDVRAKTPATQSSMAKRALGREQTTLTRTCRVEIRFLNVCILKKRRVWTRVTNRCGSHAGIQRRAVIHR